MVVYMQGYINNFFHAWAFYISIFTMLNFIFIFPIIFHAFVIPKIEKRLGKKLNFKQVIYKWQIFSSWFQPPVDIGMFISILYVTWKLTGEKVIKRWERDTTNAYALAQTNYDISQASFLELLMSFLSYLNMLIFGFILIFYLIFK